MSGRRKKFFVYIVSIVIIIFHTNIANGSSFDTTDDGFNVRWRTTSVDVIVDSKIESIDGNALGAVVSAFDTWNNVRCKNVPHINVEISDLTPSYVRNYKNEVRLIAQDIVDFSEIGYAETYIQDDKNIVEVDIVIDNKRNKIGVVSSESYNVFDIQNLMTHEIGHLLGLNDDYSNKESVMYAFSDVREINKRTLLQEDIDNLCRLYSDDPSSGCSYHYYNKNNNVFYFVMLYSIFLAYRRIKK